MFIINKVILIGNLTKDCELQFSKDGGLAIAKFKLAVPRIKKEDPTDFIPCIWFGKGAEACGQYLTKGTKVSVCGHIQTGSYTNKEDRKVYTTDVIVESLEFVGGKKKEVTQEQQQEFDGATEEPGDDDIPF